MESYNEKINSLDKLLHEMQHISVDKLHVPSVPADCFHFDFEFSKSTGRYNHQEKKLVLAESPLAEVSLLSARKLSVGQEVKEVLELTFEFKNEVLDYLPGDSFGFLCSNDADEVNFLIDRLRLQHVADASMKIIYNDNVSSKKKLSIPPLLSLREMLMHCIEIRSVPKKVLLRALANYASDEDEQNTLLYLSSSEGKEFFVNLIQKPSLSILDLLVHFPSCTPPVEKLVEYLPPLRPRFYSVTSSPLVDRQIFKILFSVLRIPKGDGRFKDREGVCTGWFKKLASSFLRSSSDLVENFSNLKLQENTEKIFLYKRKNLYFKFSDSLETPLIMVGPGTGIAPFMSYLQHRTAIMKLNPNEKKGESWLFYGCRFKDKDFLYKSDLEKFKKDGVLNHLVVSFSRDTHPPGSPKYVQDNIVACSNQLVNAIENGNVLVCGEATSMAPGIQEAFVKSVQIGLGLEEMQARAIIDNMLKDHRYVIDVWA